MESSHFSGLQLFGRLILQVLEEKVGVLGKFHLCSQGITKALLFNSFFWSGYVRWTYDDLQKTGRAIIKKSK